MTIPNGRPGFSKSNNNRLLYFHTSTKFFLRTLEYEDICIDGKPYREDDTRNRGKGQDDTEHLYDGQEKESIDNKGNTRHETRNTVDKDQKSDNKEKSDKTSINNNPERICSNFCINCSLARQINGSWNDTSVNIGRKFLGAFGRIISSYYCSSIRND